MHRRDLLKLLAATGITGWIAVKTGWAVAADQVFPVTMTDEQWQKKLSHEAYNVLREQGTEFPNSSPLVAEHRSGIFSCAGCDTKLFSSDAKFESHTGWPSFFKPIDDKAVATTTDNKLFMTRTEVHCATCGGHLGHVFDDGPKPTGLRYCMNGVAMKFAVDKV